jgi:hypothetical protein
VSVPVVLDRIPGELAVVSREALTKVSENNPVAACGSWILSLVSALLLALAVYLDPERIQGHLPALWSPALMLVWLMAGSWLISKAHCVASKYQEHAVTMIGERGGGAIWEHQTAWMRSRRSLWISIPFATLGLMIALLTDTAWYWRVSWASTVCATFYYAGHGMWGACVVCRGVASFARDALKGDKLNVFHADHLAGLGFAVKYADIATMFMFTGATALPMGIMLASKSMAMGTALGSVLSGLVALAILLWGVFAFSACLVGRSAIASAIVEYRDPLLCAIAIKKKEIIESGKNLKQLEILNIEEEAASHLRAGVITGAGAWKDLFNLVAVALALFDYALEVQKVIGATT